MDREREMAELIILLQLKALPYGGMMRQIAPISQEEAIVWAEKYQAEKVYYWSRTKSAFILFKSRSQGDK